MTLFFWPTWAIVTPVGSSPGHSCHSCLSLTFAHTSIQGYSHQPSVFYPCRLYTAWHYYDLCVPVCGSSDKELSVRHLKRKKELTLETLKHQLNELIWRETEKQTKRNKALVKYTVYAPLDISFLNLWADEATLTFLLYYINFESTIVWRLTDKT